MAVRRLALRATRRCWAATRSFSASPEVGSESEQSSSRLGHPVSALLDQKPLAPRTVEVDETAVLRDGVQLLAEKGLSSMILSQQGRLLGLLTARDLLRNLQEEKGASWDAEDWQRALETPLSEVVKPVDSLAYVKATDSLAKCQLIMSEMRIRNLPVVQGAKVVGLITAKDIMDYSFTPEQLGGKAAFMRNVVERRGLGPDTLVATEHESVGHRHREDKSTGSAAAPGSSVQVRAAASALPHPYKASDGTCANSAREWGPKDLATSLELSDDAFFVAADVPCPHKYGDSVTGVGIADGVGEGRLRGLDAGAFARTLMESAVDHVHSRAATVAAETAAAGGVRVRDQHPIRPHEVLTAAWRDTVDAGIAGSCTALIATIDTELNQLSFSNVGDAGIIVMRHIDSDVAGYLRDKETPRHMRKGDLRMAFISQQQLKSFNHPYQLGHLPDRDPEEQPFETPRHADTTSFPVLPGDTVVIATDGLFDNVELDEICSVTLDWEKEWFAGQRSHAELASLGKTADEVPDGAVEDLSRRLVDLARANSVDDTKDGPFAILAKENDIIYVHGGMPDDTTVICLRVVGH